MTADEFLAERARQQGTTVDHFREIGIVAVECNCGLDGCPGWTLQAAPLPLPPTATTRHISEAEAIHQINEHTRRIAESIERLCDLIRSKDATTRPQKIRLSAYGLRDGIVTLDEDNPGGAEL